MRPIDRDDYGTPETPAERRAFYSVMNKYPRATGLFIFAVTLASILFLVFQPTL